MTVLIHYVNYEIKILKTKKRLDKNKFKAVIFFHEPQIIGLSSQSPFGDLL